LNFPAHFAENSNAICCAVSAFRRRRAFSFEFNSASRLGTLVMYRIGLLISPCVLATALLATHVPANAATPQRTPAAASKRTVNSAVIPALPQKGDRTPNVTPVKATTKTDARRSGDDLPSVDPAAYDQIEYSEREGLCNVPDHSIGCGDCVSESDCACESVVDCGSMPPVATIAAGFDFTFVAPRFDDNTAFSVMESDGATFETFSDPQFDYDFELTPRVYVGWERCDGVGLRATWWQFDHEAALASANPPANGFGRIMSPIFDGLNISTAIPSDTFTAAADLLAYTIDVETTKLARFCNGYVGVGGGVRYAFVEQTYLAQITETTGDLRSQVDFRHSIEGFGPTISLDALMPVTGSIGLFCRGRGSVLLGDGKSRLVVGEDLDLTTPFSTTNSSDRDDLFSIADIQVGLRWQGRQSPRQSYRLFLAAALEGQYWHNAGNATSEDADLGFFGFNASTGLEW